VDTALHYEMAVVLFRGSSPGDQRAGYGRRDLQPQELHRCSTILYSSAYEHPSAGVGFSYRCVYPNNIPTFIWLGAALGNDLIHGKHTRNSGSIAYRER